MYRFVEMFTSRDGNLDPNGDPREYGISKEMMDKYGNELTGVGISEPKGCATCIYIKLDGGPAVKAFAVTTAGHTEEPELAPDRWAHVVMANPGSGYNPENNVGPWTVHAFEFPSELVSGIGLPRGWHVTTFVVFVWVEIEDPDEGTGEGPEVPEPPEGLDKYPIYVTFSLGTKDYEGYVREVTDNG